MECFHCNHKFKSKNSMEHHQETARYCLKLRGIKSDAFICSSCNKSFSSNYNLSVHMVSCSKSKISIEFSDKLKKSEKCLEQALFISEQKDNQILELKNKVSELYGRLENVAIKAVQRPFEEETVIDIDNTLSDSQFTVHDSDSDDESDDNDENYQLTPLQVGQGFTIEHREEDGYINVTNLCKAGGKQFKDWKRIQKTKAFLQVLSSTVDISTVELIKLNTGGNGQRHTWVHPQVAINIAQWISPKFDVNVSGWVYEIMMTGTVDITNTKSYKELRKENKTKDIKIQYLTKKYMKAQPRIKYDEQYVVYILTTKRMKKDRVYILGKATNLTNRLSTYNKSDEHEVVYYQGCGGEETMGCVETMTFQYLKEYREQANRERFILPEKEEIKLFSDIINKSVEFFKK